MDKVRVCEECKVRSRGRVIDSRHSGAVILRRIECQKGHRWTTVEIRPPVADKRIKGLQRIKMMFT